MNERIRELLKLAAKLANADDNKDFDRKFDMIVAEKFAQLIVRECIDIAAKNQAENMNWDINEIIKEHFGVKE